MSTYPKPTTRPAPSLKVVDKPGRLAPYNHELEEALIGSLLADYAGEEMDQVSAVLQPEDVHRETHRWAYAAMLELKARGQPYHDTTLLAHALEQAGHDQPTLGDLVLLLSRTPTASYATHYAREIRALADRRRMLNDAEAIAVAAQRDDLTDDERAAEVSRLFERVRTTSSTIPERLTPAAILAMEIQPPRVIVPGVLYEGLNVLGARPKLGKSWLCLQLALAKASGGQVFGHPVDPGPVLYLALEDSKARIQRRMKAQGWTSDLGVDLYLQWSSGERAITDLESLVERELYDVVIVDTVSRFFGAALDQMDQGQTTEWFGRLQTLAMKHRLCLLLVDHHRKPNQFVHDPIDDLFGSTGKAAVVDTALGIYRERGQKQATLMVTGRDLVDEEELSIQLDRDTASWQFMGKAEDVKRGSNQERILTALLDLESATGTRLAQYLGMKEENVRRELNELAVKGLVEKGQRDGKEVPYVPTAKAKARN